MDKKQMIARYLCLALAAVSLMYGVSRGEAAVVLSKAVNICLECIGLG